MMQLVITRILSCLYAYILEAVTMVGEE